MTSRLRAQAVTLSLALGTAALLATSNAQAQISKVNTVTGNIQTVLTGVAVTVFTLALMFAGFKMAFQHAKWSEVSNIVIGGILVGGLQAVGPLPA